MNYYTKINKAVLLVMVAFIGVACEDSNDSAASFNREGGGQGGSLARFAIDGNNLYTVDLETLRTFDITNEADPIPTSNIDLGFGVETIFPYKNNLFIGTQTGMHIVDISNSNNPNVLSTYEHILGCDPVVVEGNYAYVTIRGGEQGCFRSDNRLDVVDISDLRYPRNVGVYDMINPHGLGVDGKNLFVTEGRYGFKNFDITNPLQVKELKHFRDIPGFDVIPYGRNILMLIGDDGLYQFRYTDNPNDSLSYLSKIPIGF